MLILTSVISVSTKSSDVPAPAKAGSEKVSLIPADTSSASKLETYIVQSGDTVESIMIRFYGSYSPEKAKLDLEAINLSDLNKLQIGQKLTIPIK